jgi:predicted DCC family thiol-disulfide oxidoreductase YuxK
LCNRLVQFVLPRDPQAVFHFAALQSELGRSIVKRHGRDPGALDTVYLVVNQRSAKPVLLERARAALFVLKTLGFPWSLIAPPLGILPDFLLTIGYNLVARHRYRVFGRYDTCPLPSPEHRQRFVDQG